MKSEKLKIMPEKIIDLKNQNWIRILKMNKIKKKNDQIKIKSDDY